MNTIHSLWPLAAVLASMLAALPILLLRRHPNLREGTTLLAGLTKLGIVAAFLPGVLAGHVYQCTLLQLVPGVNLALRVDAMGLFFALVAAFLWIWTSVYSIGYMRALDEHNQSRYFAAFAMAIGATIGVAFAANLLTLYLFYELLSLSTYPLVTHEQTEEARSSGRKYLTFILGTSIGCALPAMLLVYHLTGTLDFTAGGILLHKASTAQLTLLLVLFVAGFAKSGIMPFHAWLPAAMVAPTPVSAFLHGVAVVKVGVFSLLRVLLFIFGVGTLAVTGLGTALAYFVSITILAASLIALTQDNLKRRLAYSTIGQLSYMVLGVALLTPAGMTGGLLHIAMHAFGKITLFLCAGAIYVGAHRKYVSQLDGLGRRMPFTFGAFFLGSLSLIGLPPLGGFLSKWNLVIGAVQAGQMPLLAVLLGSSLLNAAYFFPIVYRGFFKEPADPAALDDVREAPLLCVLPLCVTALGSVLLFLFPGTALSLVRLALGLG